MSPRTPEQFEELRETTTNKIMEVALELFANKGYFQTSISKIAKNAGISKGLMYNYFESKEDLLKAIIFHGIESLMEFFDPNHDGILTNDELIHFIKQMVKTLKEHVVYYRLYFSLMVQAPVLKLFENEMWAMFEPFFKTLFEYFESEGYEDPQAEVYFFQSMLDGVGMTYVSDPDNYPIDAVEKKIISMYSKKT
ncbi:MAG: TetR/AcrR family transcriptional regulator [Bacteroidales bacterium]|jgi:AcrR family transcriptional regulator|nr:TetR/AcrR family transcriptional regulator [Bacteroidales bacterium]